MYERNITKKEVTKVLRKPDQIIETRIKGRQIAQKVTTKNKKKFLYRVIFEITNGKKTVITVYRTTKISKYIKEVKNEN